MPTSRLTILREALAADPSTERRAATANEVAHELADVAMSEHERGIALEILEHLAKDVERQVREVLAEQVKSIPSISPSLARTLASDIESVALPVIRFSPVLSEDDLLALVRQGNTAKQVAIAKRENVTERVSEALVDTGKPVVVSSLLENQSAMIGEKSLHKVVDRFHGDEAMNSLLIKRATLPLAVTARLIETVSDSLRKHLVERHGLSWNVAHELSRQAGDGALLERVISDPRVAEVERLVDELYEKGKLSPTILLRALCLGDGHFFAVATARLAGVPIENATPLIYDQGQFGFKAIYTKAGHPPELFRAFRSAVESISDVKNVKQESWSQDHSRRVVERLAREHNAACPPILERLISQLSRQLGARVPYATA
ncbi:MAG TPA: DUF2336 domain-containing protein [Alphaproteobacteria bacterium]